MIFDGLLIRSIRAPYFDNAAKIGLFRSPLAVVAAGLGVLVLLVSYF